MPAWKWIDIPPVWLVGFCVLCWLQARHVPFGPSSGTLVTLLGVALVAAGAALAVLAVREMQRQNTTPVPHQRASALVMTGVFQHSRNPIYLGDLLILGGVALILGAWPALVLVAVFHWVLTNRFIQPEEEGLRNAFGDAFEAYAARVRRWV